MKTFTCREIMNNEGGCEMEFSGDDAMNVAGQCGNHIATSTDDLHKPLRDKMTDRIAKGTEEDKVKWFEWFQGEWNKKSEV